MGFDSIDPEQCREWLTYLASDELRGRATGTPGYEAAARFIAAKFREFGLQPVGDDESYFQDVPFYEAGPTSESHLAIETKDGKELFQLVPGKGLGGSISSDSEKSLEIVYIEVDGETDLKRFGDLRDKAVVVRDNSNRTGRRSLARQLRRMQLGMTLVVDDGLAASVRKTVTSGSSRNRAQSARFRRPNRYYITDEVAQKIVAASERDEAPIRVTAKIKIERNRVFGANVVGFLEGSDPKLKHEIVGIGSHLDHIGARGDVINNGADDDGSGTTGVLAVAQAFTKNAKRPRRSILFMCFSGEEKGLIGSRHYVEHPIFPNENMVVELQMDMIGRNEEHINRRSGEVVEDAAANANTVHLVGSKKLSEAVHEVCLGINDAHIGLEFEYDEEDVFSRSDHANFARKDIPIAFFFTGFHRDYHQPGDTVDKINFDKLTRVAKLVYSIGFEIADADERPKRDRTWKELPRGRR